MPAAENYLKRAAGKGAVEMKIISEQHELQNKRNEIKIADIKSAGVENGYSYTASIFINGIDKDKTLVELYAESKDGMNTKHIKMTEQQSNVNEQLFFVQLITMRAATDCTVLVIPNYENISVSLENNLVLWQN